MKKDNFDDVYKNIISEGLLDMFKKKDESSKKIQVAQTDKGSKEANWWEDQFSNVRSASFKIIDYLKETF